MVSGVFVITYELKYIKPPRYTLLCMTMRMKNKSSKILGVPGPQTHSAYFPIPRIVYLEVSFARHTGR